RAELAALDVGDLNDAEEIPLAMQRPIAGAQRAGQKQRRDAEAEAQRAIDEGVDEYGRQSEAQPRAQRALAELQVLGEVEQCERQEADTERQDDVGEPRP